MSDKPENKKKRKRKTKQYQEVITIVTKQGNKTSNNIDYIFEVNNLYDKDYE